MVTAAQLIGQISQKEKQLTETRTGVETFDPRILQSQQQLRTTTMLRQIGVKEQETTRREAKQQALSEVAALESEFAQQKAQLAPQIEALKKQEAYERGVEFARKGAMPIGLNRMERKGYSDYMRSQVKRTEVNLSPEIQEAAKPLTISTEPVKVESKPDKLTGAIQTIFHPSWSKIAAATYEGIKKIPGAKLLFGKEKTKEEVPEKITYTILDYKGEPVKTYEGAPLPEQIPKYTPYNLPTPTALLGRGVSKVTEISGKGYEALLTKVGYKGIPYEVTVLGKTQSRAFTPAGIGRAVTTAGQVGAYTAPYLGTAMLISSAERGIGMARAPIPTQLPTELKVKPEPPPQALQPQTRPAGVSDADWKNYISQIEQANKEQQATYQQYVKQVEQANKETLSKYQESVKVQKVAGVVEAGLSIGFLGYKGYKAATKPYIVSGPQPKPQTTGEALVIAGKPSMGKVELLTIQPGRTIVQTTPLKEALYFGSGKTWDFAKISTAPTTVRFTEATLLIGEKGARGVGAGTRIGDITQRTVKFPVVEGTQPPLKVSYLELVKKAPPKTIKPFELKAVRGEIVSPRYLSATERKLIESVSEKVSGVPRTIQTVSFGKEIKWYESGVVQYKGISTEVPSIRLIKAGAKSKLYTFQPAEVTSRSLQVTQVPKPVLVLQGKQGTYSVYETTVGAKGFTGLPVSRGAVDVIPLKVAVFQGIPKGEAGATTFFLKGSKTFGKEVTQQLTEQSSKAITNVAKQQVVQQVTEAASALAKKKIVSLVPKVVEQQKTLTSTLAPASAFAVTQVEKPATTQKEIPRLVIGERQIEVPKVIEIPKLETPVIEAFGSPTKQVETLKLIEVPKLELVTIPVMETPKPVFAIPKPPRVEPPRIPRTPVIPLPKTSLRRKPLPRPKGEELFIPFIKRRGQFFAISKPRPYSVARRKGISALRRSLAASLQIRKAKTGVPTKFEAVPKGFRYGLAGKEPTILVQKRRERLGTYGERAEIVRARRIKFFK